MEINVEESIKGLWLASAWEGYLQRWFPRLANKDGRLIPLFPGINVFYGRNGAGKTQLLEAIAYAADFKMSAYEGFVLHNPKISQIWFAYPDPKNKFDYSSKVYGVFDITEEDVIAIYVENDNEDTWLGYTAGFNANNIDNSNRHVVIEIIKEFIDCKNALLTRSPTTEEPSSGDPKIMNPSEFIQIVPILLPTDPAPFTRNHAREIHSSYLNFLEEIESAYPNKDDPDLTVAENNEQYEVEMVAKGEFFAEWVEEWSWSPLINLRNLGHNYEFSFVDNGGKGNLWDSDNCPIFLPAIVSYDTRPDYEEFSVSSSRRVSLSVTRELGTPALSSIYDGDCAKDELSEITLKDIGFPITAKKADKPDLYLDRLAIYVSELRSKLKFLPNFRSLDHREWEYKENPHLVFNKNLVASRGSAAERRWLNLARDSMRKFTQWVVIDEPEAGLHRTAEAELAKTLSSPSWNKGSVVVVATHSPEFLELPNAHILHIDNGNVRELTDIDREDLITLGLRPADLLTQIRVFLLVEGEHERIIFENIFREEFRRAGCRVVVARGGRNMKDVFESQMIFNFTDATIISLLDNIDSDLVNLIWTDAKKIADKGKVIEAGQYIRTAIPESKSSENVFLSQFLTLALANGQYERVQVLGLSKSDIVLYFDPSFFGIKKTWEELLELHTSSDPSFKEWATKKFGADFSVQAVERASKSMDVMPDEFGNLIMRVAALSYPTSDFA